MPVNRRALHEIIDDLPETDARQAALLLRALNSPGRRARAGKSPRADHRSGESLLRLAGIGEGPADLAVNHDRYLDPTVRKRGR